MKTLRGDDVALKVAATLVTMLLAPLCGAQTDALPSNLYQSLTWRNIGPFRGGRVVAVSGVASDPKTYYFGGVGGGVFKTTNGGETWFSITDGFLKTSSVGAICVSASDSNVIYVGMGEHTIRGTTLSHGDGIYKSTDAGETWSHLGLEETRVVSRILTNPSDASLVYVAAQGTPYVPSSARGVYRSRDGGATWQKILYVNDTTGPSDLAMDPANPRILYAAMWDHQRKPWDLRSGGPASAIYKSTDAGDNWKKIDEGLPPIMGRIGIAVSADPQRLYALVECNPKGGLYRSDNAGTSWTLVNGSWALMTRPWYYMRLTADPKNPNVVWVVNVTLSKSIDGGRTFTAVAGSHSDHHDVWINPNDPQTVILGNDGGAAISRNGGLTWLAEDNQPTAQFYRVNTDDGYPYRVYGGQQDNTTVSIASATEGFGLIGGGGISDRDWYAVGGCESGFVAFDKRDPRWIYAGCWGGQISEFNLETRSINNIMAYPEQVFGLPLSQLKYRFNYNSPIVVSRHDNTVLYHGAQKVLRSDDHGRSWREISPDLTNPRPETQGIGGGPFWPEGEIYDTLTYIAESRHDAKVIWTGSDDGVIGLTRDGGAHWQRLSLPGLRDALINEIEVSPYAPGTAYVAATRFKFNDYAPYIFKTTDFGQSWDRITAGIPDGSWSRVVREDPVRRGLLYAGTETGAFVSFDGGLRWQSLQLNLPVTPVTDLQVHDTDLVVSTQGRAFWILDDVEPLRQLGSEIIASKAFLLHPRQAIRTNAGAPQLATAGTRTATTEGTNAPRGAIIDFYLQNKEPVKIEIADTNGQIIRHFSTGEEDGRDAASIRVKPGMNRILWDLRCDWSPRGEISSGRNRGAGRLAKPATYQVRLIAGGVTMTAPLVVREDPRFSTSDAEFSQQDELLAHIEGELGDIYWGVFRSRSVREQLAAVLKRTTDPTVAAADKQLAADLLAEEDQLVQSDTLDTQRFVVEPSRLADLLNSLHTLINTIRPVVTSGQREVDAALAKEWAEHKEKLNRLLGSNLDAFNKLAAERNIPAVRAQ